MMKIKLICIFLLLGINCLKAQTKTTDTSLLDKIIKISVDNFMSKSKLRNYDQVFVIRSHIVNTEIIAISILGMDKNKIYVSPKHKIGDFSNYFPTDYIEKDGKLFYWTDTLKKITPNLISILSKYNHIDSTYIKGFNGVIPEFVVDDKKKAANYFFCKKDIRKFRRIETSIGIGYYKTPKLKCNK